MATKVKTTKGNVQFSQRVNKTKGEKIMANKNLMVTINTGKKEVVKELQPITINYRTAKGFVPVEGYAISEDVSVIRLPKQKGNKVVNEYRLVLTKCGYYVPKKNGGDYKTIEGAIQYGHRHAMHEKNANLEKYEKACKELEQALKPVKKTAKKTTTKTTKKATSSKKVAKKSTKKATK